jgi:hypothetical protein
MVSRLIDGHVEQPAVVWAVMWRFLDPHVSGSGVIWTRIIPFLRKDPRISYFSRIL